jgi:hypothetical protein
VIAHVATSAIAHKVVDSVVMVIGHKVTAHSATALVATSAIDHKVAGSVVMVIDHKVAGSVVMVIDHKVVGSVVMVIDHRVVGSVVMVMPHGVMAMTHQASAVIVHDHDAGSNAKTRGAAVAAPRVFVTSHPDYFMHPRTGPVLAPEATARQL